MNDDSWINPQHFFWTSRKPCSTSSLSSVSPEPMMGRVKVTMGGMMGNSIVESNALVEMLFEKLRC
jgi:hypothetical protein